MADESHDLVDLAAAVADGTRVDWEQQRLSHPELAERLAGMELIDAVRRFELGRGAGFEGVPADPEATQAAGAAGPEAGASGEVPSGRWGRLTILDRIGEGAFADVYRAFDPALEREVALKLPHTVDPLQSRMFLREARRLARIRHDNILDVHGAEEHEGRIGMWTDLLEGRTLEDCLREQGPFSAAETSQIGISLCRALAAVHRAGLVHRDVKTANVMRKTGGRIVLMDFSSVVRQPEKRQAPDDASTHGSPLYTAPEILAGASADRASDIYSLGVVLYRLASGRYPIEAESFGELREKHRQGGRTGLRDVRPDLPAAFVQVVERALAPRPAERFRSMGEMEQALSGVLVSTPQVAAKEEPVPWRRPRFAAALLALAAVLALALGLLPRWLTPPPLELEATLFRKGEALDERLGDGARLKPGDRLFLEVEANRPSHVYVLNEDSVGRRYVLFPLDELVLGNPLSEDATHRLPGRASPEGDDERLTSEKYWQVSSTGGRESLMLVASVRPLEYLDRLIADLPRAGSFEAAELDATVFPGAHRGIGDLVTADGEPRDPSSSLGALRERLLADADDNLEIWTISLENPS